MLLLREGLGFTGLSMLACMLLSDDLNDHGQNRDEDDHTQDQGQIVMHEGNITQK